MENNNLQPLPIALQKLLKSFGINPDDLQIAVKTAYENAKKKENENDL